jgi:hypothetical protein
MEGAFHNRESKERRGGTSLHLGRPGGPADIQGCMLLFSSSGRERRDPDHFNIA